MKENSETAVLTIEELHVTIPTATGMLHPVQGVDLSVYEGETVGVVGESGCGKSLTALAVMNLLPKRAERSAKRLLLYGENLLTAGRRRMEDIRGNRISMIFQEPMTSLNPCYTIGNQLTEALLRHKNVSPRAAQDRAITLLERVGIPGAGRRLNQYPHQLSGGLRQRVMIAMALMCEPVMIIADEPTTALDVTIQAQILLLLDGLKRDFGIGLMLITHDLGVVARTAERVVVMYAGQVVETGATQDIFRSPLHPYTRGLLDCIPVPGENPPGERLGVIPGLVPTLTADIRGCHFANRCRYTEDPCRRESPDLVAHSGRFYRCRIPPEARENKTEGAAR